MSWKAVVEPVLTAVELLKCAIIVHSRNIEGVPSADHLQTFSCQGFCFDVPWLKLLSASHKAHFHRLGKLSQPPIATPGDKSIRNSVKPIKLSVVGAVDELLSAFDASAVGRNETLLAWWNRLNHIVCVFESWTRVYSRQDCTACLTPAESVTAQHVSVQSTLKVHPSLSAVDCPDDNTNLQPLQRLKPTPAAPSTSLVLIVQSQSQEQDFAEDVLWTPATPAAPGASGSADTSSVQPSACYRRLPTLRLLNKELRKIENQTDMNVIVNRSYGFSMAALEECAQLQHLHWNTVLFQHANIILPQAVLRLDPSGNSSKDIDCLRGSGRSGARVEYYPLINESNAKLPYFISVSGVFAALTDVLYLVYHYLNKFDPRDQQLSRKGASLADGNNSVRAMNRYLLSLLQLWSCQLVGVVEHCCSLGLNFKCINMEENVYINDKFQLVFGSFGGAVPVNAPPHSILYANMVPPPTSPAEDSGTPGKKRKSEDGAGSGSAPQSLITVLGDLQRRPNDYVKGVDPTRDKAVQLLGPINDFVYRLISSNTSAWECLMGAPASAHSSFFALGSGCVFILSAGSMYPLKVSPTAGVCECV